MIFLVYIMELYENLYLEVDEIKMSVTIQGIQLLEHDLLLRFIQIHDFKFRCMLSFQM